MAARRRGRRPPQPRHVDVGDDHEPLLGDYLGDGPPRGRQRARAPEPPLFPVRRFGHETRVVRPTRGAARRSARRPGAARRGGPGGRGSGGCARSPGGTRPGPRPRGRLAACGSAWPPARPRGRRPAGAAATGPRAIGSAFGWERVREHSDPPPIFRDRLTESDRKASHVPTGTADGPFRVLYAYPRESASEIWNATVHAVSTYALVERAAGYRLYWAIYVRSVGRITAPYMRLIDPFRRLIIYPALLRSVPHGNACKVPCPSGRARPALDLETRLDAVGRCVTEQGRDQREEVHLEPPRITGAGAARLFIALHEGRRCPWSGALCCSAGRWPLRR